VKQLSALFFLFILCAPQLAKLGVYSWYWKNKTFIANELCENRDRPELACQGQCVLAKELQKMDCCQVAESTEQDGGTQKSGSELPAKKSADTHESPFEAIGYTSHTPVATPDAGIVRRTGVPYYLHYTHLTDGGVFHPPSVV
jgi:hypothetical protein